MIMMLMFGYSTRKLGITIGKTWNKGTYSLLISCWPSNPGSTASKLITRTPNNLYFLTSSITTHQNIPSTYTDATMTLSVLDLVVKFKWRRWQRCENYDWTVWFCVKKYIKTFWNIGHFTPILRNNEHISKIDEH
jgi:hypothetical protein